MFGREGVGDEDRIRAESIRNAGAVRAGLSNDAESADAFLSGLRAELDIEVTHDTGDERAFDLVNKTNQFNLNGRRYTVAEWHAALARDGAFVATATYRDKFGPLGKIAVAVGTVLGAELHLDTWVLSCRAFARRIEFAMLRALFDSVGADAVTLQIEATARNGPVREFLAAVGADMPARGEVRVDRVTFDRLAPPLSHVVTVRVAAVRVGAPGAAVDVGVSS